MTSGSVWSNGNISFSLAKQSKGFVGIVNDDQKFVHVIFIPYILAFFSEGFDYFHAIQDTLVFIEFEIEPTKCLLKVNVLTIVLTLWSLNGHTHDTSIFNFQHTRG